MLKGSIHLFLVVLIFFGIGMLMSEFIIPEPAERITVFERFSQGEKADQRTANIDEAEARPTSENVVYGTAENSYWPQREERETITVTATAYYGPVRGQRNYTTGSYAGDIRLNGDGLTKTEKEAQVGHIASDWNVLPRGSEVYVPGYGRAVVEDIGGAIQGKRIDLFMGYGDQGLEKALAWGIREVEIEIIDLK